MFALYSLKTFEVMTKADIVNRVASATGVTKLETEILVDGFFKTISEALADGEHFEIRGFGTFKVKQRKPRIARNPRTGEPVPLDIHYVPTFKPSRELRGMIDKKMKSKKK
jgi:nucleoid DNA-binding protein